MIPWFTKGHENQPTLTLILSLRERKDSLPFKGMARVGIVYKTFSG